MNSFGLNGSTSRQNWTCLDLRGPKIQDQPASQASRSLLQKRIFAMPIQEAQEALRSRASEVN